MSPTRHETSAGGIVVYRANGEPQYLLIRDSYHNWGFPKGHVEAGESFEEAALREVIEETGLQAVAVTTALEPIEWSFQFRGERVHKVCYFFLMESQTEATQPQADEGITACRWTPFAEAEKLVAYENARAVLRRAHAIVSGAGPA